MQQQASKARDKIVELSKLLEREKNEKMDLQRKFNGLEIEKEELDDEVEKLNENISSLTSERDEALEDAAQAKEDCKKALADTRFANAMKENALSTIKELEGANEKLQNELNGTREELKESIKKVEGQASKLSALDEIRRSQILQNTKINEKLKNLENTILTMAKDRESTAAKVKLMFEERGTMIQADQESYLERILQNQKQKIKDLILENERMQEAEKKEWRLNQLNAAKRKLMNNQKRLTQTRHDILVLTNDPVLSVSNAVKNGPKFKLLMKYAEEAEFIQETIKRNKSTLSAVKLVVHNVDELSRAAENNDINAIRSILNTGRVPVNALDSGGYTAVQAASRRGHILAITVLLEEYGADIKAGHEYGSPIILASRFGFANVVEYLMSRGAPLAAVDLDGRTALMNAAHAAHPICVKILLRPSQNIDATDANHMTALHVCCATPDDKVYMMKRRMACLGHLLERKLDIEKLDRQGNTPINQAAIVGNLELAKILLKAGANIFIRNKYKRDVAESARFHKNIKFTAWINGVIRDIEDAKRLEAKARSHKLPDISG
eukprot:g1620.t1